MEQTVSCEPTPGHFWAYFAGLKGRQLGAFKTAAKKIGVTFPEYIRLLDSGKKWCFACAKWVTRDQFGIDKFRWDGLSAKCFDCVTVFHQEGHQYVPEWELQPRGSNRDEPRDGDKLQARHLINLDVQKGRRPNPNDLYCAHCGHKGDDRRHEYHHHMGYAARHHYDVIPLCSFCHSHTPDAGAAIRKERGGCNAQT